MHKLNWLLLAIAAAAGIGLFNHYSKLPLAPPPESVSASILAAGFYEVGSYPLNIADNNSGPGEPRRLMGKLWFPMIENGKVAPGQHPLIIYQPNYRERARAFTETAELLASKGYLVISTDATFRGTGGQPALLQNIARQAPDTRFIIDEISRWNDSPNTPFYNRLQPDRIGLVGYSGSAINVLIASFHHQARDKRIALAVIMGGLSEIFSKAFFNSNPDLPLLNIASDTDPAVSYNTNTVPLPNKHANTWLVTLQNGSHGGFTTASRGFGALSKLDIVSCQRLDAISRADIADWPDSLPLRNGDLQPRQTAANCSPHPQQATLDPIQQYRLTQLALIAFIDMHFADTRFERNRAQHFLSTTLAAENPAARYTSPAQNILRQP